MGLNVNHQPLVVGDYLLIAACVEATVTDLIQSAYRTSMETTRKFRCKPRVVAGSVAQHIKLIKQRTGKTLPVSKISRNFLGILAESCQTLNVKCSIPHNLARRQHS